MKKLSKNSQEFGKCLKLGEKYFMYGIQDTDQKHLLKGEWGDMVQDCCVKAVAFQPFLDYPPTLDEGDTITKPFQKWCRVTGANHTLDRLRHYNIVRVLVDDMADDEMSQYCLTDIDPSMDSLLMEEYERVLLSVDRDKRDVFIMHIENGMSLTDITLLTDQSYRTTKRYYEEVKNIVKEAFNG